MSEQKAEAVCEPVKKMSPLDAAIDQTIDQDIIARLWQITGQRIEEEKVRHHTVLDRAGKIIVYTFSILTASGAALVLTKDVIREALVNRDGTLLTLLVLVALVLAVVILLSAVTIAIASKLVGTDDYRSWNEEDLAYVHLGGQIENEYAYQRFVTKAAWQFIRNNNEINDRKAYRLDKTTELFKWNAFSVIGLTVLLILTNATLGMKTKEDLKSIVEVTCMASGENNQPANTAKPQPQPQPQVPSPTPKPSEGAPMRKSENPERPIPQPDRSKKTGQ